MRFSRTRSSAPEISSHCARSSSFRCLRHEPPTHQSLVFLLAIAAFAIIALTFLPPALRPKVKQTQGKILQLILKANRQARESSEFPIPSTICWKKPSGTSRKKILQRRSIRCRNLLPNNRTSLTDIFNWRTCTPPCKRAAKRGQSTSAPSHSIPRWPKPI